MSNTQLNIPTKIAVGYRERTDTYTNKLAYVIYYDNKTNKLKKETSWNRWRDHKIDQTDFENIPTEGFILNKGVGGQRESWGWNARNEYIRVYDPRGFEFEISIANLLYILSVCTSTKGKGLEGKFIYAWDRADLVLLPIDTHEYDCSTKFTSLQVVKISKTDVNVGTTVLFKDKSEFIGTYLGRFDVNKQKPIYEMVKNKYSYRNYEKKQQTHLDIISIKCHVFVNDKNEYRFETGFTGIGEIKATTCDDIAEKIENFTNSIYHSKEFNINFVKTVTGEELCQLYSYKETDYNQKNNTILVKRIDQPTHGITYYYVLQISKNFNLNSLYLNLSNILMVDNNTNKISKMYYYHSLYPTMSNLDKYHIKIENYSYKVTINNNIMLNLYEIRNENNINISINIFNKIK